LAHRPYNSVRTNVLNCDVVFALHKVVLTRQVATASVCQASRVVDNPNCSGTSQHDKPTCWNGHTRRRNYWPTVSKYRRNDEIDWIPLFTCSCTCIRRI